MTKVSLFPISMMVIAMIFAINDTAFSDVIQPINPQMKQNLQDMSKLMISVSNELSTGNMSLEAQEAAASITKQVSQILQELSEGNRKYDVHKEGIDQMKKNWQPFIKEALTED